MISRCVGCGKLKAGSDEKGDVHDCCIECAMKEKVQFKDPDLRLPDMSKKQREEFYEKYAEFGEYFVFELDMETLTGRLLPRSEWK